jgi:carbon monoxide dehydrogenase subunit G
MSQLSVSRHIAAPPQRVWAVLADLEGHATWMADVRKLEVTSPRKSGVGATMRVTSVLFGLPFVRDVMVVTAWDPPHRMAVEHRGQFTGTGEFRLTPHGAGTLFSWREDVRMPLGVLGRAAWAVAIRPHLGRVFARSLANLAALTERPTSAA